MIDAANVSAVLVTRGDTDLGPILDTLPYNDVVIWDNSKREDFKTYGRYAAVAEARNDVIYFQDDDIVFRYHDDLLAAYEPGVICANMSPGWVAEHDYADSVMVGMGAILDRTIPDVPLARYEKVYGRDEIFFYYPEAIVSIQSTIKRVDLPAEILPWGFDGNRMFAQPWFETNKAESIRRGRALRDGRAAYDVELTERLARVDRDLGRA